MTDILQIYSREKLHSIAGGSLVGADLSGLHLRYADLRGQDMRGAVLRGACLHGANLSGANLSGADLTDADIFLAHFQGADLRGANLQGTRLAMAQFSRAQVDLQTNGMSLDAAPRMGMIIRPGPEPLVTSPASNLLPSVTAPLDSELAATLMPQTLPEPVSEAAREEARKSERWADHSRLLHRAAVRKEGKKVAYLATLTTARVSAALISLGICAYTLAPPTVTASLRLYESPTWIYGAAYYLGVVVVSYLLVQPLRDRWYGDSGLPY